MANGLFEKINIESLLSIVEEQSKTTIILPSEERVKKEKVKKGDSSRMSLQLFKSGKSIADIATERGLASITVQGHLAEFIKTGELDVLDILDNTKLNRILIELYAEPTISASSLKIKLGDNFSYGDIKAALNFAEFKQKVYG